MAAKDQVIDYLKDEPKFRERANKDKGIANLLLRKYPLLKKAIELDMFSRDTLIALMQDYATMDRAWRQALEHDPTLRGSDYEEKVRLEQEKQIELGYRPSHDSDIKKLSTLR